MSCHATPRLGALDPKAARIAALSEEYLIATALRRSEIGEEIAGLMSGRIGLVRTPDAAV